MDRLAAESDSYVRARTPALPRTAYLLTGLHVTGLRLRIALARLTPKQRAVTVLRLFEDLTEVDTAERHERCAEAGPERPVAHR